MQLWYEWIETLNNEKKIWHLTVGKWVINMQCSGVVETLEGKG